MAAIEALDSGVRGGPDPDSISPDTYTKKIEDYRSRQNRNLKYGVLLFSLEMTGLRFMLLAFGTDASFALLVQNVEPTDKSLCVLRLVLALTSFLLNFCGSLHNAIANELLTK